MTYETAKKLRDGGWPQGTATQSWSVPLPEKAANDDERAMLEAQTPEIYSAGTEWGDKYEKVAAPTLTELIEAVCTDLDHDFHLSHAPAGWSASTGSFAEGLTHEQALNYPTPEEAVANLWLALQAKPPTT